MKNSKDEGNFFSDMDDLFSFSALAMSVPVQYERGIYAGVKVTEMIIIST